MRILVTGSSGRIGASVAIALRARHHVLGLDRVAAPSMGRVWRPPLPRRADGPVTAIDRCRERGARGIDQ
jgi:nucleoside-diphosphate-sugar epimerase